MNHDRFGNPIDDNGHDILADDFDEEFESLDEPEDEYDGQPTEYEEWQDVYGGDDAFVDMLDNDLGYEF